MKKRTQMNSEKTDQKKPSLPPKPKMIGKGIPKKRSV